MSTLFNVILPVLSISGLTALAQRWLKLDVATLSRAAFYLCVPALIFEALLSPDLDGPEFGKIALGAVVVTLILGVLAELTGRALRLPARTRGAFAAAIMLSNVGAYGLPVLTAAFGKAAFVPASAFLLAFNMVLLLMVGLYLAALGQGSAGQAVKRLAREPILYATLAGVAVRGLAIPVPEAVFKAVTLLGQATVPLYLLILGLRLAEGVAANGYTRYLPALGLVLVGRFIVSPLIALWVADWLALAPLARSTFVVDCALPTAILVTVLASEFDADTSFATLSVFVTTIVSLLPVTLWINYFR